MSEATYSMQEENSSLWSLSSPLACDKNICFSFLLKSSCSFSDRREIPANRHTVCTLWVSMEKFSLFPLYQPKAAEKMLLLFGWVLFFQLSIFWCLMPNLDFFSYACGVFMCRHWAHPRLLSISVQRKQAVSSPWWQQTKKSQFCKLVCFTSGWS